LVNKSRSGPGTILTVKGLSKRAYKVIHTLPRGYRMDSLSALLEAAADLSESNPDWYKDAIAGNLMIGIAGDGR